MGYVPSEAARLLVGQPSPTIGVAIPDFTDPFYMNLLCGVEEVAIAHHHELFVGSFNQDLHRQRKLFDAFDQKRLAGFVIAGSLVDAAYLRRDQSEVPAVFTLMNLSVPPSAIVCYNDRTAIGVINGLHKQGLSVPDDLSVIGFDDLEIAAYFLPSLTTVRQPHTHLGRQAAEKLFALMYGANVQLELLEPELIRRESTGPLTQANSEK